MNFETQTLKALSQSNAGDMGDVVFVVSEKKTFHGKRPTLPHLPSALRDRICSRLATLDEDLKEGQSYEIPSLGKNEPHIVFAALPKEREAYYFLSFFRGLAKKAIHPKVTTATLILLTKENESELVRAFGAALAARRFLIPVFGKKKKDQKPFSLNDIQVFSSKKQNKSLSEGVECGEGTNLVRELGQLPANELRSSDYGKRIRAFAKEYRLGLKVYSNKELKRMGAGAFTAVDQGDPQSQGAIYELTYNPRGAKNKKWATLVGKGICFDTGGYDVKTSGYMKGMKGDMQGSAVALSTLLTAARLKLPIKIKCFLGVTENHISPLAYKVDDVVTALNGMSIEVINTDAEGRMVLADTLCLASKAKPQVILDFATLTGCATIAIGTKFSAAFTNNDELHDPLWEAGLDSGEQVWTFPLDEMYADDLKSSHADILQCAPGRGPDHIHAAYFLSKFVGEGIDWVHVDLSASENKGGLAHSDTEFTGFGVLFAIQFLKSRFRV